MSSLSCCTISLPLNHAAPWASTHRSKWGQLTRGKMDEKLKREKMQKKEQFYMFMS